MYKRQGNGSIKEVKNSLMLLTTMMQSYYAKPVILLIDEYDAVSYTHLDVYKRQVLNSIVIVSNDDLTLERKIRKYVEDAGKKIGSAEFIQYDRNHHFIFVLSDQACRPGGIAMDESGIRRQPV